jgi:hypothetical protein
MASIKSLSQFKSALIGGGARPNLFEVELTFPTGINQLVQADGGSEFDLENFKFMCKAAALPASNVASIDVPFRGRTLKVAGDRTFDTWTITVINDESFSHRRSFEAWMQNIAQYSDHTGLTDPGDYMATAVVRQLGRGSVNRESGTGSGGNANVLAQYKFYDIFPTNIAAIDLSYDTSDSIEEFTVEFQIQFFAPEPVS